MFVVALILIIVVALLVIAALFGGGDPTTIDLGSFVVHMDANLVFFSGMVTLLLFVIAVGLLRTGARRASARRADRKKVSELSNKLDAYRQEERESAAERDAGQ